MISNGAYRKDRGIADTGIRMPLFHSLVEKIKFLETLVRGLWSSPTCYDYSMLRIIHCSAVISQLETSIQ
jgi:hypothetical protein